MLQAHIDHIAVTAPSLEAGIEYVRQALGVTPQFGGAHPRMGTHNRLLKLGEACYLEVIAINPEAPKPNRPRWFRLDETDPSRPIRLAAWIARTNDIAAAVKASPMPLGAIEPMSRGQMHWHITIPEDGGLPLHGIAPVLIEWPAGVHPAAKLPDSGCRLIGLEGFHPQAETIIRLLDAIGFAGDFQVFALPPTQRPYLIAHIQTPAGERQLSFPGFPVSS